MSSFAPLKNAEPTAKAKPSAKPALAPVGPSPTPDERAATGALPAFLRGLSIGQIPVAGGGAPAVQAKLAVAGATSTFEEEADTLAGAAAATPSTSAPEVTPPSAPSTPNRLTGTGGDPLSHGVRQRMEPLLGMDLGGVRVHQTGPDQSAAAGIRARAFTHREHIFLGRGESAEDVGLIAHELTHVAQQSGGAPTSTVQRKPSDYQHPEDGAEPHARMQQHIQDELGDDPPPAERPEIDRAKVHERQGGLQPEAHPAVDRPAAAQPGVEAAAAETARAADAPGQAQVGGAHGRQHAGGAQAQHNAGDDAAAAAQDAFSRAAVEPPVTPAPPVMPIPQVSPVDAAGRAVEPVPNVDAAIVEIADATQGMRDEGIGLQEVASTERANAQILEGNVNLIRQGVAQSDLGVVSSQAHAAFRRSVVQQGHAALDTSREKTAWVAEQAPQYLDKANEGRADSQGMADEAGSLSSDASANQPDDDEAAERSQEQTGNISRASSDVGSLDRAFSGSQERSRGLSRDAAHAAELNTQVDAKLAQSTDMLQRTEDRLGQMRKQTDQAGAQVEALSRGPGEMAAQADEAEEEGRRVVEISRAVEERLRAEQERHRTNAAAIPGQTAEEIAAREAAGDTTAARGPQELPPALPVPAEPQLTDVAPGGGGGGGEGGGAAPPPADAGHGPGAPAGGPGGAGPPGGPGQVVGAPTGELPVVPAQLPGEASGGAAAGPPAGGGDTVVQREPQAGYEDRWNVDLASPLAAAIPSWLGGSGGQQGETREEHEAREQARREQEVRDIQEMAGKPFEETSSWERRRIALRLMGRHLWSGLSGIRFPGWGTLALGLINPVTPLLGVVSGFSMIASGVANIFNVEAWRRDWLGNLLKVAADIATGLVVILGSITALAAVIAALCTALIIVSFGFAAPVLGPVVAFCSSVMVTVGGWTIAVGWWALALQALCFIKNLYEAGVARNAQELQQGSDRMSSDVAAAGNVVLQMGTAKLAQIGGRSMQSSIARAGGGARWAGGLTTRFGAALRPSSIRGALGSAWSGLGRGVRAIPGALSEGAGALPGLAGRGVRALGRGLASAPGLAVDAARAAPGALRSLPGRLASLAEEAPGAVRGIPGRLRQSFGTGLSREFMVGERVPSGFSAPRAAAEQGRWAAQLEDAITALRTPGGAVDAAARARLLAQIPEVSAANAEEVQALAARTLGVPPDQLVVRLLNPGEGGASGAQVYRIAFQPPGGSETTVSFVKVFPSTPAQVDEFGRELSALQRLNQEALPNQGAVRAQSAGRTATGEGVLVLTAARGTSIDSMLQRLGSLIDQEAGLTGEALAANRAAQQETFEALRAACRRNGEAAGQLHTTTAAPAATPETYAPQVRAAREIVTDELPRRIADHPELGSVDFVAARERLDVLIAAMERNPGAASVVHGDFHPGNIFYDAADGRITLIDTARVHQSIDQAGASIATPARDVATFETTLGTHGGGFGVPADRIQALRDAFSDGYASAVAASGYTPEALAFYRARIAAGRLLDALNKNPERVPAALAAFQDALR